MPYSCENKGYYALSGQLSHRRKRHEKTDTRYAAVSGHAGLDSGAHQSADGDEHPRRHGSARRHRYGAHLRHRLRRSAHHRQGHGGHSPVRLGAVRLRRHRTGRGAALLRRHSHAGREQRPDHPLRSGLPGGIRQRRLSLRRRPDHGQVCPRLPRQAEHHPCPRRHYRP